MSVKQLPLSSSISSFEILLSLLRHFIVLYNDVQHPTYVHYNYIKNYSNYEKFYNFICQLNLNTMTLYRGQLQRFKREKGNVDGRRFCKSYGKVLRHCAPIDFLSMYRYTGRIKPRRSLSTPDNRQKTRADIADYFINRAPSISNLTLGVGASRGIIADSRYFLIPRLLATWSN